MQQSRNLPTQYFLLHPPSSVLPPPSNTSTCSLILPRSLPSLFYISNYLSSPISTNFSIFPASSRYDYPQLLISSSSSLLLSPKIIFFIFLHIQLKHFNFYCFLHFLCIFPLRLSSASHIFFVFASPLPQNYLLHFSTYSTRYFLFSRPSNVLPPPSNTSTCSLVLPRSLPSLFYISNYFSSPISTNFSIFPASSRYDYHQLLISSLSSLLLSPTFPNLHYLHFSTHCTRDFFFSHSSNVLSSLSNTSTSITFSISSASSRYDYHQLLISSSSSLLLSPKIIFFIFLHIQLAISSSLAPLTSSHLPQILQLALSFSLDLFLLSSTFPTISLLLFLLISLFLLHLLATIILSFSYLLHLRFSSPPHSQIFIIFIFLHIQLAISSSLALLTSSIIAIVHVRTIFHSYILLRTPLPSHTSSPPSSLVPLQSLLSLFLAWSLRNVVQNRAGYI